MLFAHRHLFALSWRAPPQLDASLRLYAISRSPARSTTSFSTSVQAESSLRLYENLRDKSSDATTLSSSAFTAATVAFSFAIAYRSGAARRAQEIHAPHRSRSTDANRAPASRNLPTRRSSRRSTVRHVCVVLPLFWNLRPFSTDATGAFPCSSSAVIVSFSAGRIERRRQHHVFHSIVKSSVSGWD